MKPSIFNNEQLARLGSDHFRLFQALWCMADREGRLEDRPEKIEANSFPFKFQKVNIPKMLDDLTNCSERFITRYQKGGKPFIQVNSFLKHNSPHVREKKSIIPAPNKHSARTVLAHLNPESPILNPSSLNPESKTSSAKAGTPFWQNLIDHIDLRWTWKKKGARYLWSGKDFAALKRVLTIYQPWDVMALYDVFIQSSDDFAIRQGFSVTEFVRQLPVLVDGLWKAAAEKYHTQLEGPIPGDINKLVASIPVKEISKGSL